MLHTILFLINLRYIPCPGKDKSKDFPQSICVDKDGTVWVGTYGAGIYRYSPGKVLNINTIVRAYPQLPVIIFKKSGYDLIAMLQSLVIAIIQFHRHSVVTVKSIAGTQPNGCVSLTKAKIGGGPSESAITTGNIAYSVNSFSKLGQKDFQGTAGSPFSYTLTSSLGSPI